ncbi:MAG: cytochrome-c oxidase, cbb3-type subunit I, partial [Hyphomonas sp.]|nr:cytochrome-c oxidase, cbb3-type subunit I [Hyphomonas sp.]
MEAHAWIFFTLTVAALAVLVLWAGSLKGRDPFDQTVYDDTIVKVGVGVSMFWGIVGFLVGLIVALQLAFPNIFYFDQIGWLN